MDIDIWREVFDKHIPQEPEENIANREFVKQVVAQVIDRHIRDMREIPRAKDVVCESFPYLRRRAEAIEEERNPQAAKNCIGQMFGCLIEFMLTIHGIKHQREYPYVRADGSNGKLDFVLFDIAEKPFCFIETKTRPRSRLKEYLSDCAVLNLPMSYLVCSGEDAGDMRANGVGRVCVSSPDEMGRMIRAIVRRANQCE